MKVQCHIISGGQDFRAVVHQLLCSVQLKGGKLLSPMQKWNSLLIWRQVYDCHSERNLVRSWVKSVLRPKKKKQCLDWYKSNFSQSWHMTALQCLPSACIFTCAHYFCCVEEVCRCQRFWRKIVDCWVSVPGHQNTRSSITEYLGCCDSSQYVRHVWLRFDAKTWPTAAHLSLSFTPLTPFSCLTLLAVLSWG